MAEGTTIIIKKIKKGGHGHHGGAWKIAYADFVTAMMAFFLLMWLLSSTSEGQKNGIAEYFTPTIGIKDQMGIGFKGGEGSSANGHDRDSSSTPGAVAGSEQSGSVSQVPSDSQNSLESPENNKTSGAPPGKEEDQTKTDEGKKDKTLDMAEDQIKKAFDEDPAMRSFKDSVLLEQTPEGLRIQIVDLNKFAMFESGTAKLSAHGKSVLKRITEVVEKTPNMISITGYTDTNGVKDTDPYSNWELSADRANASRRFMLESGLTLDRTARVEGRADHEPLVPNNPESELNRRISIILLKKSSITVPQHQQAAPGSLLTVPKASDPSLNLEIKEKLKQEEPTAPLKPDDAPKAQGAFIPGRQEDKGATADPKPPAPAAGTNDSGNNAPGAAPFDLLAVPKASDPKPDLRVKP